MKVLRIKGVGKVLLWDFKKKDQITVEAYSSFSFVIQ